MSRMSEVQKRNLAFIWMLCVILMLAVLLVWNLMGNKGENKNSAEGAASSSSAPSDGGQQSSVPSSNATGRGDHKCDVPVAPDKAFSAELPSDYQFKKTYDGIKYPVSATYGPTYTPGVVGYCFAHNPAGAAMAAITYMAAESDINATEAERRGLLSKRVASEYKPEAPESHPADSADARIAGYDIRSYSPERAMVDAVFLWKLDGQNHIAKFSVPMVWEDGDWRVDTVESEIHLETVEHMPSQVFKARSNGGE